MNDINNYLKSQHFIPSKKLGQNFLHDENIINKIINSIPISQFGLVVEIGPGLGALTKPLSQLSKPLILVELDKRLYAHLDKEYRKNTNINIINDDILNLDWDHLINNHHNPLLISNLPYSISSPTILKFLQSTKYNYFYCMLQKEMAIHLTSRVGDKKYNAFTALVQYYTKIDRNITVSRNCFIPEPQVDSEVLIIQKNEKKFNPHFFNFLKSCFSSKRKTLVNNLKSSYNLDDLRKTLESLHHDVMIRAEALNPNQLHTLWQKLKPIAK